MMARSTMLHVRVDDEIKAQASEALAAMGLSVSDAVRILLKRVVNDQAFPLELKVPNTQTREAMEEARAMARHDAAWICRAILDPRVVDRLELEPLGPMHSSRDRPVTPARLDHVLAIVETNEQRDRLRG